MKKYNNYNDSLGVTYRPRKIKHVHFIKRRDIINLENDVNIFADEHPEYKILGIKLTVTEDAYIATITYLCDAEGGCVEPYYDDRDPENDED